MARAPAVRRAMTKKRGEARNKVQSESSSEDEDDGKDKSTAPPAKKPSTAKKQHHGVQPTANEALKQVARWIITVHEKILKIGGFQKTPVEGKGDCSFLAFSASHEIRDDTALQRPTVALRLAMITTPLRKGGVELLATGVANGVTLIQESELELVAKHLNVRGGRSGRIQSKVRGTLQSWANKDMVRSV